MPFFSARPTAILGLRGKSFKPFLLRQIITTGYVAAGYRNSVTWRNVNSNNHSTDTTTNLGDLLQEGASYTSGAHNRNNAFIWGTNGTGSEGFGAFTKTSCFNMRNNTTLTKTSAMDTAYTVGDSATMQDQDMDGNGRYSWQNGNQGAAFIQKFNLTTEAHLSVQSTSFDQGGTGAAAHYGETFGYFWSEGAQASVDANANGKKKFVFATETESTAVGNVGWFGQQKGIVSKLDKGYAGNEGGYAGGNNLRVWSYVSETYFTVVKPIQDSGEENFIQGQTHNYMLGMYGAPGPTQNNRSWKFSYATNSGSELGASGQPTGIQSGTGSSPGAAIDGRSSGHGFWRD